MKPGYNFILSAEHRIAYLLYNKTYFQTKFIKNRQVIDKIRPQKHFMYTGDKNENGSFSSLFWGEYSVA